MDILETRILQECKGPIFSQPPFFTHTLFKKGAALFFFSSSKNHFFGEMVWYICTVHGIFLSRELACLSHLPAYISDHAKGVGSLV